MNNELDHPAGCARPAVCARPMAHARCPYCHDEVFSGGVRCGCCGARHHSMCIDEYAACATCGYDLQDAVHRVLLRESEARDSGVWRAVSSAVSQVVPHRRTWHESWEAWRRSVTYPLFLGSIAVAGGLTLLAYIIERVATS